MSLDRELDDILSANAARFSALAPLDLALRNNWRPPYMPSEDRTRLAAEYNELIRRSELNVLRLVVDALVDRLHVVGFRLAAEEKPDNTVWGWWQASSLDQRQILVHRDAASYGDGFVLVIPDGDRPMFKAESPLSMAVEFDPYEPTRVLKAAKQVGNRAWLYTDTEIVAFERAPAAWDQRWQITGRLEHAAGECPVIRFANNLDSMGRSMSEVEPVLSTAERLHQTIFDRMLLQRSQAWRQRWAAGIVIDEDEDGNPINPFKLGADQMLIGNTPDAKFGEFAQADLTGLLKAADEDIRAVALISRTPPHYLPSTSISNLSSETLVALEAALASKVSERKHLWGESWEHAMRIGGRMVGWDIGDGAEVVWENLELQSEAQRVDAAVKLKSIGVPLEYLLERLSLSPQEIERVMRQSEREALDDARAQAEAFGVRQVIDPAAPPMDSNGRLDG